MRRFLCGILALTLLVGSLTGCSNTSQSSPFSDADSVANKNELTPDDANAILREHIKDSISADFVSNIYIWQCSPFADGHNPGMLNLAIEISLSATSEQAYAIGQTAHEILDAIPQGLVLQKQEYETMHLSLEFKCADNGIYNHYNYYLYDKYSEKYVGNGSGTVYEKQDGAFLFAPADKMTREANLVFENGFKGNDYELYEHLQQGNDGSLSPPDDVQVVPPAEWEEMPLHKCINCGGTARLASGAWCCDNCPAVYGEEDFAEKVSLDAFAEGTWWDTYSQRCNLTIDVIDDETIVIEINWSSGASDNTQWIITAKWDGYWGLLRYENGVKQNINEAGTTVGYEDGSGFFYINSGNLYWVDYKESAGFDCIFEFPIY